MKTQVQAEGSPSTRTHYVIRIRGALDDRWAEWFSGMQISTREITDGIRITTLDCPAVDQAQLRGVLNKIWDLNLSLLSVQSVDEPRMYNDAPDIAI